MKRLLLRWSTLTAVGLLVAAIAVVATGQVLRDDGKSGGSLGNSGETPVASGASSGDRPYQSYAFEAKMTSAAPGSSGQAAIIRGWYEAPSRTRWDIGTDDPAYAGWMRVQIVTEDGGVFYEPTTHEYIESSTPIPPEFAGNPMPIFSNIAIGPLVSYFDPFGAPSSGSDEVIGRRVKVFAGQPTFYVDMERQFVLKQVFVAAGSLANITIEVTKVAFDEDIPDSVWKFTPPAVPPVTATPTGGTILRPTYVPAGYSQTSVIKLTGSGITDGQSLNYAAGSATLHIRQEYRAGSGTRIPPGTPVPGTRIEAYWKPMGNGGELGCVIGNVTILITSTALPRDELVRIAEGLR